MASAPSRSSTLLVAATALGIAFVAGRWTGDEPAPTRAAPAEAAPAAAAPAPSPRHVPAGTPAAPRAGIDLDALRDEIRAAVRDELVVLEEERAAAAPPARPVLPPEVVRERVTQARAMLDSARGDGRMDHAAHEEFHAALAGMPREDQEPLLSELHQAINAQQIALDLR